MTKYHKLNNDDNNDISLNNKHDNSVLRCEQHQGQQRNCNSDSDTSNDVDISFSVLKNSISKNNNSSRSTIINNKPIAVAANINSSYSRIGGGVINSANPIDMDEHTMEVPLLQTGSSNNNNNNNDYDHCYPASSASSPSSPVASSSLSPAFTPSSRCRCGQPGFSVDLTNKSAQEAKLKILLATALCCIFMIIEFLGGYMAGSLAIMTDAAHLASDCISFVIGLVAIWLGRKPPDRKMSFGYKRMEVIGAIVSIFAIWILTATLVIVAVQRILTHDYDLNANTMMTISAIGILINIAMIFILHGSSFLPGGSHGHSHHHGHAHGHHHHHHDHHHLDYHPYASSDAQQDASILMDDATDRSNSITNIEGNECNHTITTTPNGFLHQSSEKNLNLRAAMIHVIGDLVQSVGVFLAAVLIKFFPSASVADPLCTLVFSVIVIMTTVHLFQESVTVLLDAVPPGVNVNHLEMDLERIEGVKSVHHLNVWSHTTDHNVMMAHLVIDFLCDSNSVLEKATRLAQNSKYKIKHSTIQIERLPS